MSEICFNLWYYLDHQQNIVAIAAKAYVLEGSDEEKASALFDCSGEFLSVSRRDVTPVHFSILRIGVEEFFAPEFDRIRRGADQSIVIPEEKLYYATPLFDFGQGFVPAEIGNDFIRERPDPWLDRKINALVSIYSSHPDHNLHGSEVVRDLERIGEMLNEKGGMKLMQAAHSEFSRRCKASNIRDSSGHISAPRSLEYRWDGIGEWLG